MRISDWSSDVCSSDLDEVLRASWQKFLPDAPAGLALIAVGGYGRGELLPHSDIDILLLHRDGALERHRAALERMTTFGWDIGLEVGQSAGTVAECVDPDEKDIAVITNMLEARLVTSDAETGRASCRGEVGQYV